MKTPVHKPRIKNRASNIESRLTHSKNHFGATRQTTSAVRKPAPRKDARPKGKRTDPFRRDANQTWTQTCFRPFQQESPSTASHQVRGYPDRSYPYKGTVDSRNCPSS